MDKVLFEVKAKQTDYEKLYEASKSPLLKKALKDYTDSFGLEKKKLFKARNNFLVNIEKIMDSETTTQEDIDLLSYCFLHVKGFSELEILTGINMDKGYNKIVIEYYARLKGMKVSPNYKQRLSTKHLSKIRAF